MVQVAAQRLLDAFTDGRSHDQVQDVKEDGAGQQ
jgi:hypothetical protein